MAPIVITCRKTGRRTLLAPSDMVHESGHATITTDDLIVLYKEIGLGSNGLVELIYDWNPDRPVQIWYSGGCFWRDKLWSPL